MKTLTRLPIVAIVGRPNVGKSTLFNRIIRERKAIVHEEAGMTRDRHYGHGDHRNKPFVVIDTGGYEDTTNSPLLALMREQTLTAIAEADAVIFLTEQSVTADPIDDEILQRLRVARKPFYLAVNKCDSQRMEVQAIVDFSVHGLDQVFPVSALNGDGVLDLLDAVTEWFEEGALPDPGTEGPIRVALVGRQNVGKSTLTNRLLGQKRMIESEVAGTTRDAIDTDVVVDGQAFTIIDTAGMRRRGRIDKGPEMLSVHSSFAAIDRCDVALILIDAAEGITAQDAHVAGYVLEQGRACIIVMNKWDAVKDREKYGEYVKKVREDFKFLKWAPVIMISARTGQRAFKLWGLIRKCAEQYRRRLHTAELNVIMRRATSYVSPPVVFNRQLKLKYVVQTGVCPPRLTFFVNDPQLLHFSYERYLQNQFRAALGLEGTPLHFRLREAGEDTNPSRHHPRTGEQIADDVVKDAAKDRAFMRGVQVFDLAEYDETDEGIDTSAFERELGEAIDADEEFEADYYMEDDEDDDA